MAVEGKATAVGVAGMAEGEAVTVTVAEAMAMAGGEAVTVMVAEGTAMVAEVDLAGQVGAVRSVDSVGSVAVQASSTGDQASMSQETLRACPICGHYWWQIDRLYGTNCRLATNKKMTGCVIACMPAVPAATFQSQAGGHPSWTHQTAHPTRR